MNGRFALDRSIFDNPVVGRDGERFRAWVWMIARACWKPTRFDIKGRTVTLQRGQFATSYRALAEEWGWSLGAVQRFMTRLKTDTMIDTATDTGQLIVTICNYCTFQFEPSETDTPTDTPSDTGAIQERYTKEESNKDNNSFTPAARSNGHKQESLFPKQKQRASRLPEDWALPKAWGDWAVSEGLTESQARDQAARFRDFWLSKSGKDATKLDWQATWRNWIRNFKDRQGIAIRSAETDAERRERLRERMGIA